MPFSVWVDALDAYVVVAGPRRPRRLGRRPGGRARPGAALAAARRTAAPARSPTSATAPTAPSAACSSWLADAQPLVLVLDDLHWSDGASIELIAALLRRGAGGAGAARARLPPRAGARAPGGRDRAAERPPARARTQLSEAEAARLLDDVDAARAAGDLPPRRRQPLLPRAARRGPARRRRWPARPRRRSRATTIGVPAAVSARSLAEELESLSPAARAMLDAAAVAGEPFEPDLAAAIAELSGGRRARRARRPAGPATWSARPRSRAASSSATRWCAARSTSPRAAAGGSPPTRAPPSALAARGRRGRRARAPRRAVGRGRATRRRSRCCWRPADAAAPRAPGGGGALVRGGAAPAPERRPRAPGRRARGAGLGAALGRRARALPRDAARGDGAAPAESRGAPDRADRPLRRRRALAGPPRRRPPAPGAGLGRGRATAPPRRRRRCRSSWPWTGCTRSTTTGRSAMGARGARDRERARRPRADRRGRLGAVRSARRSAGRSRPRARTARRRSPRSTRLSDAELAPRLEALYYLGWAENYLEHYDEAIAHADRGIAIARATGEGRLLIPMMLVKGYPLEIAGPAGRGAPALRGGSGVRAPVGQPPLPVLGAVRARLGPLLRRRPRRRRRRLRGERARGRAPGRRHDAGRQRRPGLAARVDAVRDRATSTADSR